MLTLLLSLRVTEASKKNGDTNSANDIIELSLSKKEVWGESRSLRFTQEKRLLKEIDVDDHNRK